MIERDFEPLGRARGLFVVERTRDAERREVVVGVARLGGNPEIVRALRSDDAVAVDEDLTMGDMWSRKVFVALLRRYGINPYRYKRQRYTTVMARVSNTFVEETLWPEFEEISKTLQSYLSEVTERVVSEVIHEDSSEADVVSEPRQLSFGQRRLRTSDFLKVSGKWAVRL